LRDQGREHDELTSSEKKLYGHDESHHSGHGEHDADSDDDTEIHDADSDDDEELHITKIANFGGHNVEDSRRRRV